MIGDAVGESLFREWNGGGLFSAILFRLADAIKPLRFHFNCDFLLLSCVDEIRDGFGKLPNLFDQFKQREADEFNCIHVFTKSSYSDSFTSRRFVPPKTPYHAHTQWEQKQGSGNNCGGFGNSGMSVVAVIPILVFVA
jgi:hypothetical protein